MTAEQWRAKRRRVESKETEKSTNCRSSTPSSVACSSLRRNESRPCLLPASVVLQSGSPLLLLEAVGCSLSSSSGGPFQVVRVRVEKLGLSWTRCAEVRVLSL